MTNLDATTPQLKAVKRWIDAYTSLDMNNLGPVISKNYQYQSFPKSIEVPKEAKERHIERLRERFSGLTKYETNFHEVIEAPGKVVLYATNVFHTVLGAALTCDTFVIVSLVEEDGELKILNCKVFLDPQEYGTYLAGTAKAAAHKAFAS